MNACSVGPEMKGHQPCESGFALLEVIVAIAIAALALATIYRTMADGFRSASRVDTLQAAVVASRSHLDALAADGTLNPGTSTGAYANGIRWRLSVTDLSTKTLQANALRPFWIKLVATDKAGVPLIELETAKLAREAQP